MTVKNLNLDSTWLRIFNVRNVIVRCDYNSKMCLPSITIKY